MTTSKLSDTPTILDVARHAGVSVGTVSHVLNDRANVSDGRRNRVLGAIADLAVGHELGIHRTREHDQKREDREGDQYLDEREAATDAVEKSVVAGFNHSCHPFASPSMQGCQTTPGR